MPRLTTLMGGNLRSTNSRSRGPSLGNTTTRNTQSRTNAYFADSAGDQGQSPYSFYGQGGTFWPVWYAHKDLYIYEVRFLGPTQASGNFAVAFGYYRET